MPQKILFLVPYPLGQSPSQRFRFEQYLDLLRQADFHVDVQSFLDSKNWRFFFTSGNLSRKVIALATGFSKRVRSIFFAYRYDYIFIHREATPIGPPVFEWIYSRVLQKKIIYDFDDAIWLTDRNNESLFIRTSKWRSKIGLICKWSYRVACGNDYLLEFAKKYTDRAVLIPTTIDPVGLHNPELYRNEKVGAKSVVIGWTGSHSTLKYLEDAVDILRHVEMMFPHIQYVVIADRKPTLNLSRMQFIPWNANSEIPDLMRFDIGIMPLPDDIWTRGKCGFKALQYMALKIPAVASPVGVNNKIIDHGKTGFLCSNDEEWLNALSKLIQDQSLRAQMGESGRQKVIDSYSVESNAESFLKLFE